VALDLETICLKCLEKDPGQRFPSAQAMADDLDCFLQGQPVRARPISRSARVWRWCRREPALAGAVAACFLVLLLGAGGVLREWQLAERNAKNEERQRERAEQNAAKSKQVARFLQETLRSVASSTIRDRKQLLKILDTTARRVSNELKDQPDVQAEILSDIGQTYQELGDFHEAETLYRQALAIGSTTLADQSPFTIVSLDGLANALSGQNRQTEAEALLRRAIALSRDLPVGQRPLLAVTLDHLGLVLLRQSQDLGRDAPRSCGRRGCPT
jgi:serine/threonine-protein kinase